MKLKLAILLKFPKDVILEGDYIIYKPDVSEKEFWEIANEDSNYELIDGVLVIHSPASEEQESIFSYLNQIIGFYLAETNLGKIYGSRFVMRLSKTWNPEPDLLVILSNNYENIKENYLEGPADLVIEILSKATKDMDLNKKIPNFLKFGVKEMWIIDPFQKSISIHSKERNLINYLDSKSNTIIDSQILPKINFQVRWLWNREQFPSNIIIKNMFNRKDN